MLTEFLIDVEVLTVPEARVWVESETEEGGGHWEVSVAAQYKTQTILDTRPETKTQSDLDRVIGLGKSAKVREAFQAMVDLGNSWDWCYDYIYWLNDVDTYEKFIPEDILDEEGEVIGQTSMEPVGSAPVRKASITLDYKALRVAAYPELSEFADAYTHLALGTPSVMEDYIAKCQAVKEAFPK